MAEALTVELRADIKSFSEAMNQANQSLLKLVEGTKKTSQATNQMANAIKGIGAGIAAAFAGKAVQMVQQLAAEFIDLAEAPTKFKASLEALTGSSSRATNMLQRVYEVSKKTGTGFGDTAALVQKLAIGLGQLGANNAQIAQIAENLLKLGTIGGSSIADTAAAAQQLSQALASGKLQGDELRSILERMPTLAQIIAKEMGVSVGELKKLGAEGKITSDIIANSLLKATNQINADFAKMPLTVAQAMNNVKTSIQQAFDNPAAKAGVQAIALAVNQMAVAIRSADIYIRNFASNASRMFADIGNAIGPIVGKVQQLGASFSGIGAVISGALSGVGNILAAAFIGPIGLIISNWDKVRAYFANQVPAMFYNMVGAAQDAMAAVTGIFQNAWNAILGIVESAINKIISAINSVSGAMNSLSSQLGGPQLIGTLNNISLATTNLTNTTNGWRAAATGSYGIATQYAQRYNTELRTIARTQAEQTSLAEAGTTANNDLAAAFKNVAAAAEGGGGGGGKGGKGGGGGGAAGGIKKAGDAAKKAAADMKAAQSQVEEFGQAMQGIAQSLGSGVVDALFSIADGSKSAKEAFSELAKSMLKQIAQMIMQMLILKPLMGMFGGGLFGGGMMGGGGGLMGMARSGASPTIGSYDGFRMSPAAMTSVRSSAISVGSGVMHQAPMNVTVNNNSSAVVKTRQESDGLYIDLIEEVVSDRITRGGNRIDQAMQRAFGARRVGY